MLGTAIHTEHDQDGIQLGLADMGVCVCLRWCSNSGGSVAEWFRALVL